MVQRVPRDSEPPPIDVFVQSERLLRKGGRGFRDDEEAFQKDARDFVVDVLERELFDCDVSVYVDIHAPERRQQQPMMPPVVKAYLDALEGIAYRDDLQIAHLVVHRHGLDHPWLIGMEPPEDPQGASVMISVRPIATYTRLYDTAFQLGIRQRKSPWWRDRSMDDDWRLGGLRGERAVKAFLGQDTTAIDNQIAFLDEHRLTDTVLAGLDRPGPLQPEMRVAETIFPAHRMT